MTKVENGSTVQIHYTGTFDDGTEFDSSHSRGEALTFAVGSGQVIKGFNDAVLGMSVGEKKSISIEPSDAYGEVDPSAVHSYPQEAFPKDLELSVNSNVVGEDTQGRQLLARIDKIEEGKVYLDFNHPMAGKRLNFDVELLDIK